MILSPQDVSKEEEEKTYLCTVNVQCSYFNEKPQTHKKKVTKKPHKTKVLKTNTSTDRVFLLGCFWFVRFWVLY